MRMMTKLGADALERMRAAMAKADAALTHVSPEATARRAAEHAAQQGLHSRFEALSEKAKAKAQAERPGLIGRVKGFLADRRAAQEAHKADATARDFFELKKRLAEKGG